MMFRTHKFFVASLASCSLAACVTSSQVAKRDGYVDPTNVTTFDGSGAGHTASARAEVESAERERDVLKGQLEDAQFASKTLETENRRLMDELVKTKEEIARIKDEMLKRAAPPVSAAIPVQGDLPQKTGAPLLWELGYKALRQNNFKEALPPLEQLLKDFPMDARGYYAALALPMVHYAQGGFKEAALGFNQLIDRYPNKHETAIAWFGQGAAFFKMGQKGDAKLFYEECVKRYPKSEAATIAKRYLARKGSGAPSDLFGMFPDWADKAPK